MDTVAGNNDPTAAAAAASAEGPHCRPLNQDSKTASTPAVSREDLQLLAQAEELLQSQPDLHSHETVLQGIDKFRGAIRQVTARLLALGDASVSLQPPPASLILPPPTHAAPGNEAAGPNRLSGGREKTLGRAGSEDPLQGDGQPADEFADLGEEGLDYTFGCVDDLDPSEWQVPEHCVPIHVNVVTFNWQSLYEAAQFDVVMMDPPWQLATANPTRGIALGYSQLCDQDIANIPVPELQREGGFLLVWVINAKYKWTLDQFERWGYRVVDEIVWVKTTVNRRLAKSHGYYLQHAKEVCLLGKRGRDPPGTRTGGVGSDIIFSMRRGNSQKPTEIYELIEELVPNGRYLEIFARKNNLRDFWVSIGNEVTGTGLPQEDLDAIREGMNLPGAVYGRNGGKAG